MQGRGDEFAERLVAGDSDRSACVSSGGASGVEGADEAESMSWVKVMTGDWPFDSLYSW